MRRVCHFAAAFRESGADEAYFARMNVEGTANVAKAAAANGVKRFVHCGTAGIYGQRVAGTIDEKTPIRPWNSYERSKLAADEQVRAIAIAAGMEYVILRPTAVYGPRDERLLKLFRSVDEGPLSVVRSRRRPSSHDLCDRPGRCVLASLHRASAANRELIVAGPKAVPLREMLHTIARAANRPGFGPRLPLKPMLALAALVEDTCKVLKINPPIYRRRMDFYLNDAAFDSNQAQSVLGWQPESRSRRRICRDAAARRGKIEAAPAWRRRMRWFRCSRCWPGTRRDSINAAAAATTDTRCSRTSRESRCCSA